MMLNTDLNLAKILADYCAKSEQSCAVKGRTIQDCLHSVCTIIEKVVGNAAPIDLEQLKTTDRVDHGFLEAVLSVAGFTFCMYPPESWWR